MNQIHQAGIVHHLIEIWKGAGIRKYEIDIVEDASTNVPISLQAVAICFALLALGLLTSLVVFLLEKNFPLKCQKARKHPPT